MSWNEFVPNQMFYAKRYLIKLVEKQGPLFQELKALIEEEIPEHAEHFRVLNEKHQNDLKFHLSGSHVLQNVSKEDVCRDALKFFEAFNWLRSTQKIKYLGSVGVKMDEEKNLTLEIIVQQLKELYPLVPD